MHIDGLGVGAPTVRHNICFNSSQRPLFPVISHLSNPHFLSTLPYLLLSTLLTHTMCQLLSYSSSISSLFLTSKANFNLCLMSRPLGACSSGYIITNSVRNILGSTNNSMLCRFIMKTSTWKSYLQLTITVNVNLTVIHFLNVRIYCLICHTSDCGDRPANTFARNKPSNVMINAERLH